MGLDLIEYTLALEDAFGVDIPEADARAILTPRDLVNFLTTRLPTGGEGGCLAQRAFYCLRRELMKAGGAGRAVPSLDTPVFAVLPPPDQGVAWEQVRARLGIGGKVRAWGESWWGRLLGEGPATLRTAADAWAAYYPRTLKPAGEPWSTSQLVEVVVRLLRHECGVDMSKYTLDSRFVQDMALQ